LNPVITGLPPYINTKKLTKPLWSFSEKIEKRLLGTFFA
jgi:hypothetical protein